VVVVVARSEEDVIPVGKRGGDYWRWKSVNLAMSLPSVLA
jgi:hypothetical protein